MPAPQNFIGRPLLSPEFPRLLIHPGSIRYFMAMLISGWRMSVPRSIAREVAYGVFARNTRTLAIFFLVLISLRDFLGFEYIEDNHIPEMTRNYVLKSGRIQCIYEQPAPASTGNFLNRHPLPSHDDHLCRMHRAVTSPAPPGSRFSGCRL